MITIIERKKCPKQYKNDPLLFTKLVLALKTDESNSGEAREMKSDPMLIIKHFNSS